MHTLTFLKRAGILACFLVVCPGQASAAGIPVFDVSTFKQSLVTAQQAVQQVANQVTQINHQVQMIQNQVRSLQTLGEGRYSALTGNLITQVTQLNSVMDTVRGVGFQINQVDQQFRNLFPASTDWSSRNVTQYRGYFDQWSAQLQDATRTAMKSQGVIENIRANNSEAQHILAQSKSADGEVRQLQATNSMLGILANQLGDMTMAMATSGRVSASVAAQAQAERDARRALMEKFTAPVNVPIDDGERF
jgi:P-type conjugative transfer protein TrbJ